ncbi:MAG: hypothetical protein ACI4V7_01500 [Succinivibrionaceae bacterium]
MFGLSEEEAMNQIKEKEYFSRYRDGDYSNDVLLGMLKRLVISLFNT